MTATASLLLGAALGVAHAAAGIGAARIAEGKSYQLFAVIALGGTLLRMLVVLAVVVAALLLSSVQTGPFLGGLGATFALGLVVEVMVLLRRRALASGAAPTAAPPEASGVPVASRA